MDKRIFDTRADHGDARHLPDVSESHQSDSRSYFDIGTQFLNAPTAVSVSRQDPGAATIPGSTPGGTGATGTAPICPPQNGIGGTGTQTTNCPPPCATTPGAANPLTGLRYYWDKNQRYVCFNFPTEDALMAFVNTLSGDPNTYATTIASVPPPNGTAFGTGEAFYAQARAVEGSGYTSLAEIRACCNACMGGGPQLSPGGAQPVEVVMVRATSPQGITVNSTQTGVVIGSIPHNLHLVARIESSLHDRSYRSDGSPTMVLPKPAGIFTVHLYDGRTNSKLFEQRFAL